jgi:SAM-dependent methyltransferase
MLIGLSNAAIANAKRRRNLNLFLLSLGSASRAVSKEEHCFNRFCMHSEFQTTTQYQIMEERLKAAYRNACLGYRHDDELEVTTPNHQRLAHILETTSGSFSRPISVLDAGCGTGRYFHCLKCTERLVGVDLSPEMLSAAETPVRQQAITVQNIQLMCANMHLLSLPASSFDFIYSLGMFGNACPVTVEICNKFYEWLTAGGRLFFNAVDASTFPLLKRARKKIRVLLPWLPRCSWNPFKREGLPFFALTKRKLESILGASRFQQFKVERHACNSILWKGVHLECMAEKAAV